MDDRRDLNGLSGWLIIVGIGTVIAPFRLLAMFVPLYLPLFSNGTWEVLTSADSEYYHPLWGPLLIGEIAFNASMVVACFCLIYFFFAKHRFFPRLFVVTMLVSLVFIPLDAWLVSYLLPDEPLFDPATAKEFGRTLIVAMVWVPYMALSKRVHATFGGRTPGAGQLESDAQVQAEPGR